MRNSKLLIEKIVTALIETLDDKSNSVRSQIVYSLAEAGEEAKEAVPILIKFLNHNDECIRSSSALALGKIGGEKAKEAIPMLIKLTSDKDYGVINSAVDALGNIAIKSKDIVPIFVKALKHPAYYVVISAAEILAKIKAKETIPDLIKALKHPDHSVYPSIVNALAEMKAEESTPYLVKLLANEVTCFDTAHALEKMGKEAVPSLIKALKSKNRRKCGYAIMALGLMGEQAKEAIPNLVKLLNDEDAHIRSELAEALSKIDKTKQTISVTVDIERTTTKTRKENRSKIIKLVNGLKDKSDAIRLSAAKALEKMGEEAMSATTALLEVIKDENENVRFYSIMALGNIAKGSKNVIQALIETLNDNNDSVRIETVKALGRIGSTAKEAIPVLSERLQNDNNWYFYRVGLETLRLLGAKPKDIISTMMKAFEHKESAVRSVVAEDLGYYIATYARNTVPDLLKTLESKNSDVRQTVVETLSQLKPTAKIVAALIKSLKDNEKVRWKAVIALGKVIKELKTVVVKNRDG